MKTIVCGLLCTFLIAAFAQADYRIAWSTIDGGGGTVSGGSYAITGTIGQPDAGYHGGGQYELLGGFWTGGPLCFVNFEDFANFALRWLDEPCGPFNDWCGGADLNHSGEVAMDDLALFVDVWLACCPYGWPLK